MAEPSPAQPESPDEDLSDLLNELRVLLPGTQTLMAFLVILPFSQGFERVGAGEKAVYVIIFVCAALALVLFTAPAAQHRLQRPLPDREEFKASATRLMIMGLIPLSVAIVLTCEFVVSEVVNLTTGLIVAGAVAIALGLVWWIIPLRKRESR